MKRIRGNLAVATGRTASHVFAAVAIYDSMNVVDAGADQGKPIAIDAKNDTNDVLVMVATGGDAGAIVGSYYIKLVGQ